ncbi:MAG: hypothetical protein V8R80_08585 [Eubacterium sp.]
MQAAAFRLEDAVRLTELQELKEDGKLDSVIQPVDEVFLAYPALTVGLGGENAEKRESAFCRSPEKTVRGTLQTAGANL